MENKIQLHKLYGNKSLPLVNSFEDFVFDFELLFMPVDGIWLEVTNYFGESLILADFLAKFDLTIPDYCQFMRIMHSDYIVTYRVFGERISINYYRRETY